MLTASAWLRKPGFLSKLVCLTFGLQVALASGFYLLSVIKPSFLAGAVVAPGFWTFARDGVAYDYAGRLLAASMRYQVPFPDHTTFLALNEPLWSMVVGTIYLVDGNHPLGVMFFNATLGALTVALVYGIAERLGNAAIARRSSVLMAFWPSAMFWSTQLLKDTASIFAVAATLFASVRFLDSRRTASAWADVGSLGALIAAVFVLSLLRNYVLVAVLAAVLAGVGWLLISRSPWRSVARTGLVAGLIGMVALAGELFSAELGYQALSPYGPSAAHFDAGVAHQQAGRSQAALDDYRKATALNDDFWPAYYNAGFLLLEAGDLEGAQTALARYLATSPDGPRNERWQQSSYSRQQADETLERRDPGSIYGAFSVYARGAIHAMAYRLDDLRQKTPTSAPAEELERLRADATEIIHPMYPRTERPFSNASVEQALRKTLAIRSSVSQGLSPAKFFELRRGSLHEHGGLPPRSQPIPSLRLADPVPESGSMLDILKWLPSGFASVLFAPYPWDWFRSQGTHPAFVVVAGLESLVVLLLLPFGIRGGWRLVRSGTPAGVMVVALFFLLAAGLGTTFPIVGTLFRLRLSVMVPYFLMVGLGWFSGATQAALRSVEGLARA